MHEKRAKGIDLVLPERDVAEMIVAHWPGRRQGRNIRASSSTVTMTIQPKRSISCCRCPLAFPSPRGEYYAKVTSRHNG